MTPLTAEAKTDLLPELLEDVSNDTSVQRVALPVFQSYPDILYPSVKKRGISAAHLKQETGPLKIFKYIRQIFTRRNEDQYAELRDAISQYNQDKSETNLRNVMGVLNNNRHLIFDPEIQIIISNVSGLERFIVFDSALGLQLQALRRVTITNWQKNPIAKLPFKFTSSSERHRVQYAIDQLNSKPCQINYQKLVTAIFLWYLTRGDEFRKSGGLELLKNIQSLKDYKHSSEYQCLVSFNGKHLAEDWNFAELKPFSIPENLRKTGVPNALLKINQAIEKKELESLGNLLQSLGEQLQEWIDEDFDNFQRCNGETIVKAFAENLFSIASKSAIDIQIERSSQLSVVDAAIVEYNKTKNIESLTDIHRTLITWKESCPIEFNRYHGLELENEVERLLENFSYQPLFLPDTHPQEVIEHTLSHDPLSLNVYLLYDPEYWGHTEVAFINQDPITHEKELLEFSEFLLKHGVLIKKSNKLFVASNWKSRLPSSHLWPEKMKQNRESILDILEKYQPSRQYGGIGADESFDSITHSLEGVRISDPRVAERMKALISRRRLDIQSQMNMRNGAIPVLKSFGGEYTKMLVTREEKIRHIRQALIDNFLTDENAKTFVPIIDTIHYRLDFYEEDSEIVEKWVEDPQGQFVADGDRFIRCRYTLNDGNVRKVQDLDTEANLTRGNIIRLSDGNYRWNQDPNGQYIKLPDTNPALDRIKVFRTKQLEPFLMGGETEWCSSYSIRMLHGAYMHTALPEYPQLYERFVRDFKTMTDFESNTFLTEESTKTLYELADAYAKQFVDTKKSDEYFANMPDNIQISSRTTPKMLHQFLLGQSPSLLGNVANSLESITEIAERDLESIEDYAHTARDKLKLGAKGALPAAIQLGFNSLATTVSLIPDAVTVPARAWKQEEVRIRRMEKAGVSRSHAHQMSSAVFALGKRFFWDYLSLGSLARGMKNLGPKQESAFAGS